MNISSRVNGLYNQVRKEILKDVTTYVNKGRWLKEDTYEKSVDNYLKQIKKRMPAGIVSAICDTKIRISEIIKQDEFIEFNFDQEVRVQFKIIWDRLGKKPNWFTYLMKKQSQDISYDDQEKTFQDESYT